MSAVSPAAPAGAHPRLVVALAFFAFILIGAADGASGVLLPSLQVQYGVSKAIIALGFLAGTTGYLMSAFSSGPLVARLGIRRFLVLGAGTYLAGALVYSSVPPLPVLYAAWLVLGFGVGIIDAGLNAYVAGLPNNTMLLNWLHAFYGAGALIGPLVATAILAGGGRWNMVYMVWAVVALLAMGGFARLYPARTIEAAPAAGAPNVLRAALRLPVVWVGAFFLLIYTGVEGSLGSWSYSLLTEARAEPAVAAGWMVSGYWAGLTAGRVVLGALAVRLGPVRLIHGCLAGVVAGAGLLWIGSGSVVSAVALALIGFSLGPVFPTAIALLPTRVAARLLASAIGFMVSGASVGAALLPWAAGNLADRFGLPSLLPFVMALSLALVGLWLGLLAAPGSPAASEG
ncbi:MAG TPA: MFS transporter [Chloroflexia bacterium]|nr:MFS transporter [Chloroflexia bacterium]